jgi:hypothetical protein
MGRLGWDGQRSLGRDGGQPHSRFAWCRWHGTRTASVISSTVPTVCKGSKLRPTEAAEDCCPSTSRTRQAVMVMVYCEKRLGAERGNRSRRACSRVLSNSFLFTVVAQKRTYLRQCPRHCRKRVHNYLPCFNQRTWRERCVQCRVPKFDMATRVGPQIISDD